MFHVRLSAPERALLRLMCRQAKVYPSTYLRCLAITDCCRILGAELREPGEYALPPVVAEDVMTSLKARLATELAAD